MDTARELGQAIRDARKHYGLTQVQLAELAGVSDRTLRDIEQGKTGASFANILAVAEATGVRLTVERTS